MFAPTGLGAIRLVLFALTVGFAVGAVRLRDGQRRHAVALVNAAGLATLVLARRSDRELGRHGRLAAGATPEIGLRGGGAAFGWKL